MIALSISSSYTIIWLGLMYLICLEQQSVGHQRIERMERILTTSMESVAPSANNNISLVNQSTPRMEITVETAESVYFTMSPAWRTARTHSTLSPTERIDYYKAYDPLTGIKIAATLSGLLTMAVLYVFYKVPFSPFFWSQSIVSPLQLVAQHPTSVGFCWAGSFRNKV